jgi:hypothetical protein
MPQPAGHSRQVVAYHVASPGMISSGGTMYGMSLLADSEEHPVTAAVPVRPNAFRKLRRLSFDMT